LEKKLSDLEEKYGKMAEKAPIEDGFDKEWKPFQKSLQKEFPNATPDELEEAENLMNELSHTKGVGGKVYKDENGRELLNPYELDYIYFKNKDKFSELMTGKKVKGMERSRNKQKERETEQGEKKNLPKGASAKDIREYEKRSAQAMEGMDNLSEPVDDTI
jgi:hypothetical protein